MPENSPKKGPPGGGLFSVGVGNNTPKGRSPPPGLPGGVFFPAAGALGVRPSFQLGGRLIASFALGGDFLPGRRCRVLF